MDVNPVPINQTSYFLIKSGTGIFKLRLLRNLVIEYMGHMPHPNRAAKRNDTNKSGMPSCQQKIKVIALPPIEIPDCIASRQRSVIKTIKVADLNAEITMGLLQNFSTMVMLKRLSLFSSSIPVGTPRKITSSSMSVFAFESVIARSITFSSSFTLPG